MRRLLPLLLLVLPLVPSRADALTIRDVVELTRAGLSDDILLALIDVDRSVFPVDATTLKSLKDAGVSEKVIVAMIRSGRTPPPPAPEPVVVDDPAPQPEPQVIVIDHRDPEVREVYVPTPVYVPFVTSSRRSLNSSHLFVGSTFSPAYGSSATRFIPTTGLSAPPPPPPVYWGNGGRLRPDAWGQPRPEPRPESRPRSDSKPETKKK